AACYAMPCTHETSQTGSAPSSAVCCAKTKEPTMTNSPAYSAHPAMFKAKPLGFILALLLVPLAIGILILLYWYLQCKSTRLDIEGDSIVLERGLLSKEKIELDIDRVRTVRI